MNQRKLIVGFSFLIWFAVFILIIFEYPEKCTDSGLGKLKLETAVASITETELLENVRFLSHKAMAGRGTIKPAEGGYEFPSLFLARELQEYGFEPLGDPADPQESLNIGSSRSYFQKFNLWGKVYSRNVIGLLEGRNKDEIVVIGAHYDHLGLSWHGTEIFYGADDNASGTAAVLEIAEAFSALKNQGIKPKRSILIAFWGAEENGLLGSEYFVNHPPVNISISNIVTVINLDMVGRNDDKELYSLGTPSGDSFKERSPDLYEINLNINGRKEMNFKLGYDYPDNTFKRSDSWSFFRFSPDNRIPVLFYFAGEHPDYHSPYDTYEKLNYPKLARIAKMAFLVGWEVSELPKRPVYK